MTPERVTPSSGAALAIVNPWAGAGRCGRRAAAALEPIRSRWPGLEVVESERAGQAAEIAAAAASRGVLDFLVAGGDGTVFEVVNGLRGVAWDAGERRPRLGVLPLGTGNSLIQHFGVDLEEVTAAIVQGRSRRIDLLRVQHEDGDLVVCSTLTLGLATAVADTVNRWLKPLRGAAYHVGALFEIVRGGTSRVRCRVLGPRGERITLAQESPLLAVQNTSTFGRGMHVAPDAEVDDGLGDLVIVDPVSRWQLMKTLPKLYDGSHVGHPAVRCLRFEGLEFDQEQAEPVMIDGEIRTLRLRSITVEAGALDLFI